MPGLPAPLTQCPGAQAGPPGPGREPRAHARGRGGSQASESGRVIFWQRRCVFLNEQGEEIVRGVVGAAGGRREGGAHSIWVIPPSFRPGGSASPVSPVSPPGVSEGEGRSRTSLCSCCAWSHADAEGAGRGAQRWGGRKEVEAATAATGYSAARSPPSPSGWPWQGPWRVRVPASEEAEDEVRRGFVRPIRVWERQVVGGGGRGSSPDLSGTGAFGMLVMCAGGPGRASHCGRGGGGVAPMAPPAKTAPYSSSALWKTRAPLQWLQQPRRQHPSAVTAF